MSTVSVMPIISGASSCHPRSTDGKFSLTAEGRIQLDRLAPTLLHSDHSDSPLTWLPRVVWWASVRLDYLLGY
jgi:hypothetical protein